MCRNVYDDITDYEICGFHKNTKPRYLENETFVLLQMKKIHLLHIKGYFMAKNTFVAELTFKVLQRSKNAKDVCDVSL